LVFSATAFGASSWGRGVVKQGKDGGGGGGGVAFVGTPSVSLCFPIPQYQDPSD